MFDQLADQVHLAFEKGTSECFSLLLVLGVFGLHRNDVVEQEGALHRPLEFVLGIECLLSNVQLFEGVASVPHDYHHAKHDDTGLFWHLATFVSLFH